MPRPHPVSAPEIVGRSPALLAAMDAARRVAPTTAAVLLRGESGTGKELFARLIHAESGRTETFVPVNCAALPGNLLESVLFGHRRGAFTGATESSAGLVQAADGGTLFLDEVGELPATVQAKLLRVLQERRVLAVGESRERPVDLRVVAASHEGLRELVAQGRFREDLFYRLARYELDLPPLRDRGRDAVLIARAILRRGIEGLSPRALARSAEAALVAHPWPGNVRELENALFRAALAARGPAVTSRDLCLALGQDAAPAPTQPLSARVLDLVGASEGLASGELAEALSVPRATLKRLLRALVDAGDLVAHGAGKATRYHRPSEAEACQDPRERTAMGILDREGRVSRQALAEVAGISARTAGRVLAGMVAAGLLVPDGRRGNAAGYVRVVRVAA
ncbi:MAG: sigma 54-interacting transcriptional regulator [Polyangiaceae bacterium]|nr:sigma 54-interacting transcriptional regulator [Polyangiaceae bacterium]